MLKYATLPLVLVRVLQRMLTQNIRSTSSLNSSSTIDLSIHRSIDPSTGDPWIDVKPDRSSLTDPSASRITDVIIEPTRQLNVEVVT